MQATNTSIRWGLLQSKDGTIDIKTQPLGDSYAKAVQEIQRQLKVVPSQTITIAQNTDEEFEAACRKLPNVAAWPSIHCVLHFCAVKRNLRNNSTVMILTAEKGSVKLYALRYS